MSNKPNVQSGAVDGPTKSRWRRWMVGIALFIPAVPVLMFLILFQLNPERAIILVSILLHPLIANSQPPALFADQLSGSRLPDRVEASRQLTALLAQGFKRPAPPPQNCTQPVQHGLPLRTDRPVAVSPPQDQSKSLKYEWGSGVCGQTIWVRWSTDVRNVVTLLDGYYFVACL